MRMIARSAVPPSRWRSPSRSPFRSPRRRAGAGARRRCCPTSPSSTRSRGRRSCRSTSRRRVRRAPRMPELSEDDPFYEFFRRFGQVPRAARPSASSRRRSVGSGFIMSAATATSITNAHVVDGADEVTRALVRPARVQGQGRSAPTSAPTSRCCKIEAKDLPQGHDRRSREAQGRRVGGRDRQAVRPREHDDRRHRQREGARPAAGEPRPVHPDRRRDQSRQLRRSAVQPARRGRRHQLADLSRAPAATWASRSRSRSTSR